MYLQMKVAQKVLQPVLRCFGPRKMDTLYFTNYYRGEDKVDPAGDSVNIMLRNNSVYSISFFTLILLYIGIIILPISYNLLIN